VTTVDLTDNAVQSVDPLLGRMMPRLQRLQLAGNQLVELPTAYLETPTAVEHLRSVTLGGNPFRCECSSSSPEGRFPSQRWISRHRELLVDAVSVLCVENVTHAKQAFPLTL
jgi:hypothetical protein